MGYRLLIMMEIRKSKQNTTSDDIENVFNHLNLSIICFSSFFSYLFSVWMLAVGVLGIWNCGLSAHLVLGTCHSTWYFCFRYLKQRPVWMLVMLFHFFHLILLSFIGCWLCQAFFFNVLPASISNFVLAAILLTLCGCDSHHKFDRILFFFLLSFVLMLPKMAKQ